MADFTHVNVEDLEDIVAAGGFEKFSERWEAREIWRATGAKDTGALHLRLRPGKRSPFTHRHGSAEEVYVVLQGTGRVKLNDEIRDVGPLDAIRVAAQTTRAFEAGDDGLEILAFGPRADDGEVVEDPWTE